MKLKKYVTISNLLYIGSMLFVIVFLLPRAMEIRPKVNSYQEN